MSGGLLERPACWWVRDPEATVMGRVPEKARLGMLPRRLAATGLWLGESTGGSLRRDAGGPPCWDCCCLLLGEALGWW